jgi:aldehyde dehydrogenase (NAD+)
LKKDGIAQVVNQANFDRVKGMFDDAVAKGATVAVGGTFEAEDLTIHPTMLTDVTPQMTILQDEIFAPVIPVMTYESLDQAIGYIEARDKPLALYVYSPDENVVETVWPVPRLAASPSTVCSRTTWKTTCRLAA